MYNIIIWFIIIITYRMLRGTKQTLGIYWAGVSLSRWMSPWTLVARIALVHFYHESRIHNLFLSCPQSDSEQFDWALLPWLLLSHLILAAGTPERSWLSSSWSQATMFAHLTWYLSLGHTNLCGLECLHCSRWSHDVSWGPVDSWIWCWLRQHRCQTGRTESTWCYLWVVQDCPFQFSCLLR